MYLLLPVLLHNDDRSKVADIRVIHVVVVAKNTILSVDNYALDEFPIVFGQVVLLIQPLFNLVPLLVIGGFLELQR